MFFVGGLIGLGIPEDEAKEYEGYVDSGKILVLVEDNGRGYQAHDVFRGNRSLNTPRYEGTYNEDSRVVNSANPYGSSDPYPGENLN